MTRLLLIALAFAMAACTTSPVAPIQATGQGNITGIATLALWGEWESELAPAYTRLAVVRHRAARLLNNGKITVDTAIAVQKTADQARALLDQSRRGDAKHPTEQQRGQLAEAHRLIDTAEALLEH